MNTSSPASKAHPGGGTHGSYLNSHASLTGCFEFVKVLVTAGHMRDLVWCAFADILRHNAVGNRKAPRLALRHGLVCNRFQRDKLGSAKGAISRHKNIALGVDDAVGKGLGTKTTKLESGNGQTKEM